MHVVYSSVVPFLHSTGGEQKSLFIAGEEK
jgi:hypothetical protein